MKKLMLFSMWLAGSAAAVGVAWAGVSVVDNQVVDPPSATELTSPTTSATTSVSDRPATERATPTPLDAASSSPTADQIEEPSGGNDQPTASTPATRATAAPSNTAPANQPTSQPTTAPPARPAPNATPSTQPTPTTPAPAPTAPATPAATTETFTLTGGTAAISFSSSGVEVLWATPNPGFDVSIEPESPGIKVEFRADHHRSRVDAWWSGGPQHSIREEPQG